MVTMRKTTLEKLPLTDPSLFLFQNEFDQKNFEDPEQFVNGSQYPFEKLIQSIKTDGFIADHPDRPYHPEIFHELPQTLVFSFENGVYRMPMGNHRLVAARAAGLEEIDCYVEREVEVSEDQLAEFKAAVDFMNECGNMDYQSWTFPGGFTLKGRDPSSSILHRFNIPISIYAGRTILDIACHTGFFAIQTGIWGATEIVGFDINSTSIQLANMIAKAYRLANYKFTVCEFWDYPFDKQYDIVFLNQAMYHFTSQHRSQCKGSIDDMLDHIASVTKRILLMFTFVDVKEAPCNDGGWYPTSLELIDGLRTRGFREVSITHQIDGAKKHVVAVKEYTNVLCPELDFEGR